MSQFEIYSAARRMPISFRDKIIERSQLAQLNDYSQKEQSRTFAASI